MADILNDIVDETGSIPLAWAGSTTTMDYLNFGDALSPVMVSLVSGKPVHRVPTRSKSPRLAAVGTIGHGFSGGDVWFWGTGCSNWRNPSKPLPEREAFVPSADSRFHVSATRGPVSERLLNGGKTGTGVYGDPVWLLPQFYTPKVEKKWKIGCILHLSDLGDRELEAHPREGLKRYGIPAELDDDVHLITTVTPISVNSLQDKIDEIVSCERIVSTSLHGMVIAESYGIPCLYFSPSGPVKGATDLDIEDETKVDLRLIDLYRGLGHHKRLRAYVQPRDEATDWAALMRAVDDRWSPVDLPDAQALIDALPVKGTPLTAPAGQTIWDHPVLQGLVLQHDVAELRAADKRK